MNELESTRNAAQSESAPASGEVLLETSQQNHTIYSDEVRQRVHELVFKGQWPRVPGVPEACFVEPHVEADVEGDFDDDYDEDGYDEDDVGAPYIKTYPIVWDAEIDADNACAIFAGCGWGKDRIAGELTRAKKAEGRDLVRRLLEDFIGRAREEMA